MGPAGHTALGVGTATFIRQYGLTSSAWQRPEMTLLRRAIESGVRYVDTVASYGDGESVLGEMGSLLEARGVRVCTKVEVKSTATTADIVRDVEMSLERLRHPAIDMVMAHSASQLVLQNPALSVAWSDIKARGLTKWTGVSTYGVDDASVALGLDMCDVVQVEHSILNQEVVRAAVAAKRPGQELVVRSVLCKGLLTARRDLAPDEARTVKTTIDDIEALAEQWRYTLPELAIRFALDTPGVDVVLVGVGTTEELATALDAASREQLDDDQLRTLRGYDRSSLDSVHPERWGLVALQ